VNTRDRILGRVVSTVLRGPNPGNNLLLWTYQVVTVAFTATSQKKQLITSQGTMPVPFVRMEPDILNTDVIYIGEADVQPSSGGSNSKWITTLSPGEFFQIEQDDPWDSLSGHLHLPGDLGYSPSLIEIDHAVQMVDLTQFWGVSGINNQPPTQGQLLYITIGQRTFS
jgi:hypothetical protein